MAGGAWSGEGGVRDPIVWRAINPPKPDDFVAFWRGLVLRIEDMGQGWWWAVSLDPNLPGYDREHEISCWDTGGLVRGDRHQWGRTKARAACEAAAREWWERHPV